MDNDIIIGIILVVASIIIGLIIGYMTRKNISEKKIGTAEELANQILDKANKDAENSKKESILEAKEEVLKLRTEQEKESKDRRVEIQRLEKRVLQKEENLDKKMDSLERKDDQLNKSLKRAADKEKEYQQLFEEEKKELERIAGLSTDEAKSIILNDVRKEVTHESAQIIRELELHTKDESEKRAREIIGTAIQRYAADHVVESTVTVVSLPNDEMKGRIIGREGRNIRAFETLTGIDLIIDDTPEAVVLSGFDPIRREIARVALEKLIIDGRIHPSRIEEMIEKAKLEVEAIIKESGELACDEAGIYGIHPEIVKTLGRLKYRTSYGQNVLKHSVEVANLAGMMAADLGADVRIAKRGGLLHDLGKAIDHEMEGPHVDLGVALAKKYKESKDVLHCIEAHHGDVDPTTVEAMLVQASDAISAARPGARRESLENYVKRLENLEEIANSFEGIEKSFAMQAGRELRIMVKPDNISEDQMILTARDIAQRIENELEYPGQIKVNVIRETRATDYAK